jgi:hypothetical protein
MGYTALDLRAVGVGFLLFGLFAFAPGYTFGWLSNLFAFRRRRLATRLAVAVPLSIGLTPITAYFLWRWWLPLVWIVFGTCGAACAILLVRDTRANRFRFSRAGWLVLAIAMGWLVVGTLSLIDLQFGHRLYFPVSSYDSSTRTAFTAALSRDGIPPHNPFIFAGQPAPLRYHYFWLIPCSLVDQLGGSLVSARIGVIAGTLWAGLGLLAIIALYLRFFQAKGGDEIERRTLIAVALLGVTGLDILPVLLIEAGTHVLIPTIEWWNLQISAWVTTMLWVPHDLAGLLAGLTGFLLTWDAARQSEWRQTVVGLVGGGLCFASAVGASVYVGMTVAAGCALWLAVALVKHWRRHAWVLASAGVLAAAFSLPFLLQVTQGLGSVEASSHSAPIAFTVRSFTFMDLLLHPSSPGKLLALNATLLPLNYFLELGFFFVVACLGVRRIWRDGFRDQAEWCAATLGVASLLVCTFMRSGVIANNDLGTRSPLVVQFILLLWAAEMWNEGVFGFGPRRADGVHARPKVLPSLVAVTIALGVMGSCYELGIQRTFPIVSDLFPIKRIPWLANDDQLGRRAFELRRAYDELNRLLPASATVQADPNDGIGDIPAELYSGRQMAADVGNCGAVFGGSQKFCDQVILPRLKPLFDDPQPVPPAEVADTCREFSITALLFKDTDPVWKDKSSWIWKANPLLSNSFVRVIPCGGGAGAETYGDIHP